MFSPGPLWPEQSDGNPEKHLGKSFSSVYTLRLLVYQSSTQETNLSGMLS